VVVTGFIWLVILRQLGIRTRPRWVGIFFQAQLAKYIPGSVWHYAGRAALARSRSIPLRPVLTSMTVELVAVVTAAGLVATLAAGFWAAGATAAVLVLAGIALTQRGLRRAGVRLLVRLRIAGTVVHRPAQATAVAAACAITPNRSLTSAFTPNPKPPRTHPFIPNPQFPRTHSFSPQPFRKV